MLLEFRRTDGTTVYRFRRDGTHEAHSRWKRTDVDLWCLWDGTGWCIADAAGARLGWPRDAQTVATDDPPVGRWVSRKGDKSYEYDLVFVDREAP